MTQSVTHLAMKSLLLPLILFIASASAYGEDGLLGTELLTKIDSADQAWIVDQLALNGLDQDDLAKVRLNHRSDGQNILEITENDSAKHEHLFLVGARLGIIYLVGLQASYVELLNDKPRLYADVQYQTSLLVDALGVGGGIHLGRSKIFFIGAKAYLMTYREWNYAPKSSSLNFGPELGFAWRLGKRKGVRLDVRAGVLGGFDENRQFYAPPNVSVGLSFDIKRR
jgi:hypothetical protein